MGAGQIVSARSFPSHPMLELEAHSVGAGKENGYNVGESKDKAGSHKHSGGTLASFHAYVLQRPGPFH